MDPVPFPLFQIPAVSVALHQPEFDDDLAAAQQLRLIATGGRPPGRPLDPARMMPGRLRQTSNLFTPNDPGLTSVLPSESAPLQEFEQAVPLHAVDLSGYGLSCFSDWHLDSTRRGFRGHAGALRCRGWPDSYEVIKFRTVLGPCQARVVRNIVMERRNSGRVQRFDTGWVAIDHGTFTATWIRDGRGARTAPDPQHPDPAAAFAFI